MPSPGPCRQNRRRTCFCGETLLARHCRDESRSAQVPCPSGKVRRRALPGPRVPIRPRWAGGCLTSGNRPAHLPRRHGPSPPCRRVFRRHTRNRPARQATILRLISHRHSGKPEAIRHHRRRARTLRVLCSAPECRPSIGRFRAGCGLEESAHHVIQLCAGLCICRIGSQVGLFLRACLNIKQLVTDRVVGRMVKRLKQAHIRVRTTRVSSCPEQTASSPQSCGFPDSNGLSERLGTAIAPWSLG